MTMACTRLALWLLNRAPAHGVREALIGDLIEEIARGRSRAWVCRQLIGFYGVALGSHVKKQARVTPFLVAFALGMLLLGGVSVASLGKVLEVWMSLYLFAGTLSLFGHGMSRNPASRALLLGEESPEDRPVPTTCA
jgi:hypothetical protein